MTLLYRDQESIQIQQHLTAHHGVLEAMLHTDVMENNSPRYILNENPMFSV